MWVMGTEPGPSGRETHALSLGAISPALSFTPFWDNSFANKKMYSQVFHIMHSHMTPLLQSSYAIQFLYNIRVTHLRTT